MKVILAIKTLVHSVGGAERLVASLCNALTKTDMDVHLLTFDTPSDTPFYAVDSNVTRHYVCTHNTAAKTRLCEYPKLLWHLRREIVKQKPDVVVAFMHSMFVPVQCALLGTGIKVVLSEHTVPAYYKTRLLEMLALRFFAFFATSVTIVSENVRSLYPWPLRQKMSLLPNLIDGDFVRAEFVGSDLDPSKIILSVGRLNRDKDHAILIEAFALLANDFPDWRLIIYGEGEEYENLSNRIAAHGLQRRITLAGVTDKMDDVYKAAQIFVQPSKYENFGLVTAEAMTHGLPLVGFADCSGTTELIFTEKNGLLVPKRTKEDLAEILGRLMRSGDLRQEYGGCGYDYAQRNFLKEEVVGAWMRYLKAVSAS